MRQLENLNGLEHSRRVVIFGKQDSTVGSQFLSIIDTASVGGDYGIQIRLLSQDVTKIRVQYR